MNLPLYNKNIIAQSNKRHIIIFFKTSSCDWFVMIGISALSTMLFKGTSDTQN